MTDDEIRAMPTTDFRDFITWRYFVTHPEAGWLDAVEFETEAYVEGLLSSEPPTDDSEGGLVEVLSGQGRPS